MEKNKRFEIGSRFKGRFSYRSKSGRKYIWDKPGVTLSLTLEELVELLNTPGGRTALQEKLVSPKEVVEEFQLEVEPEYYFTYEQLKVMVEQADVEVLKEALDYNNVGVREAIRDAALDIEVQDSNKRKLIEQEFNLDFDNFVDWKQAVNVSDKKPEGRRNIFKFED